MTTIQQGLFDLPNPSDIEALLKSMKSELQTKPQHHLPKTLSALLSYLTPCCSYKYTIPYEPIIKQLELDGYVRQYTIEVDLPQPTSMRSRNIGKEKNRKSIKQMLDYPRNMASTFHDIRTQQCIEQLYATFNQEISQTPPNFQRIAYLRSVIKCVTVPVSELPNKFLSLTKSITDSCLFHVKVERDRVVNALVMQGLIVIQSDQTVQYRFDNKLLLDPSRALSLCAAEDVDMVMLPKGKRSCDEIESDEDEDSDMVTKRCRVTRNTVLDVTTMMINGTKS